MTDTCIVPLCPALRKSGSWLCAVHDKETLKGHYRIKAEAVPALHQSPLPLLSTPSTGESDISRALDYLRGLLRGQDSDGLIMFTHEGAPSSKSRARWSRATGAFYTPSETGNAQEALSWRFHHAMRGATWSGNIALVAIFFRPNHQRIDADNLMKLVLDAGTKARAWSDDSQVTHQVSVIEKDAARPRTVIALAPVQGSLDRNAMVAAVCKRCGAHFDRLRTAPSGHPRLYCSKACSSTQRTDVRCPKCGVVFQRSRAKQTYCSNECKIAEVFKRAPNRLQRPPALCQKCGQPVSRREYTHCALCRLRGRKSGSKNRPKPNA